MADQKVALDALKRGETIKCPKCGKANLEPFNTTAEKAHSFSCPKCYFEVHYTPALDIE